MKRPYIIYIAGSLILLALSLVYIFSQRSTADVAAQPEPVSRLAQTSDSKITPGVPVITQITHVTGRPALRRTLLTARPNLRGTLPALPLPEVPRQADFTYVPHQTLFSTNYLRMQTFEIDAAHDTVLTGAAGTQIGIEAHTFVDAKGKPVKGHITLQLKEAYSPADIALAGLFTKKGKELLESGGMYYLNAIHDQQNLSVAPGKQLSLSIPTPAVDDKMELYEGLPTASGLDWASPVALQPGPQQVQLVANKQQQVNANAKDAPRAENRVKRMRVKREVTHKAIINDSLGWLGNDEKWMKAGKLEDSLAVEGNIRVWHPYNVGAHNSFQEDAKLRYLMQTNRMGWANIDRLYADKRCRKVEFVTELKNNSQYESVYISMMFKSKRLYLPGYQKADSTYSFTHGDYEEPVMPIGETALVMVSAYKNKKQYFALEQITITSKMNLVLEPVAATDEEIKAIVEKSL